MALPDLAGRVAVVTGAASGIGAALVSRCAAAGMAVVAADVDAGGLTAVREHVAAAGGEVAVEVVDVSLADEVAALANAAYRRHGAVHLLVNNAGVGLRGLAWERTLADWEWVLGVNLWGVIHGVQAFVPRMVERGEPAHVVNTASIAGLLTAPRSCIYTTSKFGVVGLSECLAHDLAAVAAPIGVSVLCPGFVRSGIVDAERHRPARLAGGPPPPDTDEERALEARTRAGVSAGREPELVADQVLDAVRQGRFWVFTHPEYAPAYEQRFAGIVAGDAPAVGFGGGGAADVPIEAARHPARLPGGSPVAASDRLLGPRTCQLLDGPSAGHLVTVGVDGLPAVDAVWVGRDGERVLVVSDRPAITAAPGGGPATLVVVDPATPANRAVVRGVLTPVVSAAAAAHLEALAAKYLGGPRPDTARPVTLLALAVDQAREERAELAVDARSPEPRANVAAVVGMLDALSRGDRARAKAAFAPDATWQCPPSMPWPPFYEGRDAIFDQYFAVDVDLFETGVTEYDLDVLNTVAEGDQVAVEMRHRSAGLDGQPYETDHSLVYVLRDGLIVAVREYIDTLYLTRALLG